jgi:hypothetical protein
MTLNALIDQLQEMARRHDDKIRIQPISAAFADEPLRP